MQRQQASGFIGGLLTVITVFVLLGLLIQFATVESFGLIAGFVFFLTACYILTTTRR